MIGTRAVASAALAAAVSAGAVPGAPGPERGLAADRLVADRVEAADTALADLEAALGRVVDAGRRGAARIVAGDEAPGASFDEAASAALDAEPLARRASQAVEAVDAARRAREPDADPIGPPVRPGDLTSIAGQLGATAEAGDAFAAVRHDAERVTSALDEVLAALADADLEAAGNAVSAARQAHDAVAAWEPAPDALPVWVETTDAMIGAMEAILDAFRSGDTDRARRAAERIAGFRQEAATADRALRIAMSEGGNAVAATALGRLAGVLDAIASARARLAALRSGSER